MTEPMEFCFSATFSAPEELVPLARAGDDHGWSTLSLSDHLINPVETRSTYPYTKDGSRRWEMGTPWPDPWVTIGHLAAVTRRLRFLTTVYILPARTPVHVAKQVGTAAVLSGNRVDLGIGMGWMEEEFDAMGTPFAKRGRRADEMLEVLHKLWTGEVVEHHGEFFDVPPLEMLPAPSQPVPVHVGGTSEAALRRAARNDGWIHGGGDLEALPGLIARLHELRTDAGRASDPFEIHVISMDAYSVEGVRRLEELGVTDVVVGFRWTYDRAQDAEPLRTKVDNLQRYADTVIAATHP